MFFILQALTKTKILHYLHHCYNHNNGHYIRYVKQSVIHFGVSIKDNNEQSFFSIIINAQLLGVVHIYTFKACMSTYATTAQKRIMAT